MLSKPAQGNPPDVACLFGGRESRFSADPSPIPTRPVDWQKGQYLQPSLPGGGQSVLSSSPGRDWKQAQLPRENSSLPCLFECKRGGPDDRRCIHDPLRAG